MGWSFNLHLRDWEVGRSRWRRRYVARISRRAEVKIHRDRVRPRISASAASASDLRIISWIIATRSGCLGLFSRRGSACGTYESE